VAQVRLDTAQREDDTTASGEAAMTKAQRTFEAIMRTKGRTDFAQVNGRYTNPNIQLRWNYFQMGWEMATV
jgi:hypothetical protein